MNSNVSDLMDAALSAALNGGYQGLLVAGFVLLTLKLFPRINASTRYVVWLGVLVIVAALPIVHFLAALPGLRAEADVRVAYPRLISHLSTAAPSATPEDSFSALATGHYVEPVSWEDTVSSEEPLSASELDAEEALADTASSGFLAWLPRLRWSSTLPAWIGWGCVLLWCGVALARLAKLMRDYRLLMLLKRTARPLPAELSEVLMGHVKSMSSTRGIRLLLSDGVGTPVAAGFHNPAVLLPASLIAEFDATRVGQVVRHEVAHLCRRDDWSNLLQQILKAVFFFLPAVWWLSRRLDIDREIACDDHVLAVTKRPQSYALTLTELASRGVSQGTLPAPAAWKTKSQIRERINMILDKGRNTSTRTGFIRAGALTVTTILFAFAAMHLGPRIALAQEKHAGPEEKAEKHEKREKHERHEKREKHEKHESRDSEEFAEKHKHDDGKRTVEKRVRVTRGGNSNPFVVEESVIINGNESGDVTAHGDEFTVRAENSASGRNSSELRARERKEINRKRNVSNPANVQWRNGTSPEHEARRDRSMEERMKRLEKMVEGLVKAQGRNSSSRSSTADPRSARADSHPGYARSGSSLGGGTTRARTSSSFRRYPSGSPGVAASKDLRERRAQLKAQMRALTEQLEKVESDLRKLDYDQGKKFNPGALDDAVKHR